MPQDRWFRSLVVAVVLAFVATACSSGGSEKEASPRDPRVTAQGTGDFQLLLSTGQAEDAEADVAVVAGDALSDEQVTAITGRLPPFTPDDEDTTAFRRPAESLPPPRVGRTVEQPFGASGGDQPPRPAPGPLEVLRHQPDGAVAVAPSLSVTFNHPMVPVGTLDALDAEDVPVQVTPAVEGRWRWLGTRTLRLEHTSDDIDRLPAATDYEAVVPAGTESATGDVLAEDFRFTFSTPAPTVESVVPGGEVIDVQPVFVVTFDQRVDPQAVLDTVTLRADGDERSIRLATDEEIAADEQARAAVEQALDGRWVAFRPSDALPGDAAVEVQVGPGTPSAEGPRTTTEPQSHRTRTRAPFAVTGTECGYEGCRPGDALVLVFNNPVDVETFDPGQVTVEPDTGASVMPFDNRIEIRGGTRAGTTYQVRVSGELRDTFGQSLGTDETLRFDVGDARPVLVPFPRAVITTDPFTDDPVVPIVSTGNETLDVTLYEVDVADIGTYVSYVRNRHFEDLRGLPDWPVIARRTVRIEEPAELNETVLDLRDAIGGGGHVVVTVESNLDVSPEDETYWNNRPIVAWVQATSLGIDALADHDRLVAWATDLRTGAPLDGVEVRLGRDTGTTDGDGLTSIDLGAGDVLVARRGDDSAVLTADSSGRWQSYDPGGSTRWYAFDGRGLFRPGDELELKGWVRRLDLDGDARLETVGTDQAVGYTVRDAFGNELASGESQLTAQGGFQISAPLPEGAALGEAHVELLLGDGAEPGYHPFQIQEFRRPEFEVVTAPVGAGPHLLTGPVRVEAAGRYFAGGVLPDAAITWQVTTSATTYSPPNWPAFTFGVAPPPWLESEFADLGGRGYAGEMPGACCMPPQETESFTYDARTDAGGRHVLQVDFAGQKPDEPIFVTANAAVEDVNRQAFASTVDVLVHPAALYVGLRAERNFVRQGEPLVVDAIVTDIDGAAVAGRQVTVTAARVVEELRGGEVVETDVDTQECVVGSEAEAVDCEFDTPQGGRYRVTAVVTDDDGGSSRTELTRWVAGADAVPSRAVEGGIATLVPDATEYAPGDTAEVLVVSPFSEGRGLLTISRAGIEDTRVFELEDGSAVLDLEVTDALVPGVDLRVDLAGSTPRIGDDGKPADGAPPRPAHAVGHLRLDVRPATRTLDVVAEPGDALVEPGASTTVEVAVTAPDGSTVEGSEVALAVVDEALLSLTGYQPGDPMEALYQQIGTVLNADRSRDGILLAPPSAFGADGASPTATIADGGDEGFQTTGSAGGGGSLSDDSTEQAAEGAMAAAPDADRARRNSLGGLATAPGIEVRSDFSAVATFEPTVVTGRDGRASIELELPDNLTRYRVMAVAADGDRFGTGESVITATLPLQVRPSPPRFANFGDAFELPVVVHNGSDEPITASVVLEAGNLTVTGPAGTLVTVPAGDRVEVRFPVAVQRAGTIRYRVTAVAGDRSDSATGELPAYTPTTTEAFATYGVVDDGSVAQPLLTPEGVVEQFGGLEIDTSSTSLQALTDAVVYLAEYDHRSADAYAARITALVSLRDVFTAFDAAGQPSPEELDATVRSDLERLAALQNDDGGFPTWQRGRPSDPFLTVQAAHAFVVAGAEGFSVSADAEQRALEYLRTIEDHFPALWPEDARPAASAYALHVRALDGDRDAGKARQLYASTPELPLDALAWLWPVVDDAAIRGEISRTVANRVTETPAAATFTTGYEESASALVLASDRRTDGIVLDALITQQPDSDLIPKVVAGLIGNQRRGGHWSNVQENGFILLAMKRYFDAFEATTPDFVARVWMGPTYTAEHAHRGRSIDTVRTVVPMGELGGDPDLIVQKDGAGRLYYRLGLRYAPSDLRLDPRDEGFVVVRTYEAIDEPSDVVRNGDGSWTIAAGAMVRVRLSMVADSARTNMALVDHLPAGLEALNPALAASPRPPAEEEGDEVAPATWYGYTWFDHQSFRDDRSEAYSAYLPAGTYDHTYVARATTPGTFVAPPAKAEEIYAPEVFGRSGTDRVTVG
ncbi:MAG: alpha-2-macroglobulin family protein [Acidimicrobiia bacterium]